MAELVCCGAWESKLLLLAWVTRRCPTDQTAFSTLSSTVPCQHISSLKDVGGIGALSDTMQQRDEQKGTRGGAESPWRDLRTRGCWQGPLCPLTLCSCFSFSLCAPDPSYLWAVRVSLCETLLTRWPLGNSQRPSFLCWAAYERS